MNPKILVLALMLFLVTGCFEDKDAASNTLIELSLYTGIPGVASLGDSYNAVTQNAKYDYQRVEVDPKSELGKLGFTEILQFRSIGTRVYFRRDGVGMITAQEPFKGTIRGKKLNLFSFSVPPVSNWETHLIKELGQPDARAAGGRFGSEGLFYNWGDMSYNRMGPNELALYRNPELSKYRISNFGRELTLFPTK